MNKKEIIDKIHDRSSSTMVENLGIKIIDIENEKIETSKAELFMEAQVSLWQKL